MDGLACKVKGAIIVHQQKQMQNSREATGLFPKVKRMPQVKSNICGPFQGVASSSLVGRTWSFHHEQTI